MRDVPITFHISALSFQRHCHFWSNHAKVMSALYKAYDWCTYNVHTYRVCTYTLIRRNQTVVRISTTLLLRRSLLFPWVVTNLDIITINLISSQESLPHPYLILIIAWSSLFILVFFPWRQTAFELTSSSPTWPVQNILLVFLLNTVTWLVHCWQIGNGNTIGNGS